MTVAEARKILKPPFEFGNKQQIRARLFLEAVEAVKQLIVQKVNEDPVHKFEDFEIVRAVLKEIDPDE